MYLTANQLKSNKIAAPGLVNSIIHYCGTNYAKSRKDNKVKAKTISKLEENLLIKNWSNLFANITDKNIELKLLLLPEHAMHEYIINPKNSHQVLNTSMQGVVDNENFSLIDFRGIFKNNSNKQCQLFFDHSHYSKIGKNIITDRLLLELK